LTTAFAGGAASRLLGFDLLELDGDDLRQLPLERRKAALARLLRPI
jgi:ATP-dependent DNA ligase